MLLDTIRTIVASLSDLANQPFELRDDTNLYDSGLSSYGAADLMIELEVSFGIVFPRHMLKRETFESIKAIAAAVTELQRAPATAHAGLATGAAR